MVLNVVGSSPICHPQEKRKIGNGSPLFFVVRYPIAKKKSANSFTPFALAFRDSAAIRTQDPRLRRALLYPAELRNQPLLNCGAKVVLSDGICKCFGIFFLKKAKKAVRPYLTKNNTDNM